MKDRLLHKCNLLGLTELLAEEQFRIGVGS